MQAKGKTLITKRFALVLFAAIVATPAVLAQGLTALAAPTAITVKTGGLQIVYPTPKPAGAKLPSTLSVTTKALAIIYPDAKAKTGLPAFKVTTAGLSVVYPTPKGQ